MEKLYAIVIDTEGREYKIEARDGRVLHIDVGYSYRGWLTSEGYHTTAKLVSLEVSEGVKAVHCENNLIKKLILPKSVERLYCYNNELTELILNENISMINCDNNNISKLDVPNSVIELWCNNNELKGINLNPEENSLLHLQCLNNDISYLNLRYDINHLRCDKTVKGLEQFIGKTNDIILV